MSRQFLKELSDGDAVNEVYLLADKQVRANRNANQYLLATLRDRTGVMNGLMWNVSENIVSGYEAGDFVNVRGKVQLYQGAMQMIITNVDRVDPATLDPEDFEEDTTRQTQQLLTEMREILLRMPDEELRSLMQCFLDDDELLERLGRAPAGIKAHHAYHGGLVEHIVNMLRVAERIDDLYPEIDSNLLLAGIFLHDLGKIRELEYETAFAYTDEGQLIGHIIIVIEMLTKKIDELQATTGVSFSEEKALRLKHMIASHHGTYEFGSPKLPMTPEAVALHHLDNLDAKVHEFSRTIDDDPNGSSNWTPFIPRIDRKLFKGQMNGANNDE